MSNPYLRWARELTQPWTVVPAWLASEITVSKGSSTPDIWNALIRGNLKLGTS